MTSKVQICNIALTPLRGNRIVSLSDNTVEAKACSAIYDAVVDEVLAEGDWSAATYRAALARTTNTPAFEYSYEFQLPTNPKCLKVIRIECEDGLSPYAIEGDKLLSNDSSVKIKYKGAISDSTQYGPYLQKAVIALLRAYLAGPVTGNSNAFNPLYSVYRSVVKNMLAQDGQQGTGDTITSDDLLDVR